MKTTDFRPTLRGPVNLNDANAIRAAIRQLETALRDLSGSGALYGSDTQVRAFARKYGLTNTSGITGILTRAVYFRWLFQNGHSYPPKDHALWITFQRERLGVCPGQFFGHELEDRFIQAAFDVPRTGGVLSENGRRVLDAYIQHIRERES